MSGSTEQQRPEPRFRVGQVIVETTHDSPWKVERVEWNSAALEWNYEGETWIGYEEAFRPLSAHEIGGDEVADLAQRLTAADQRVLLAQQVSDSLLEKLAVSKVLIKGMLDVIEEYRECDRIMCNCHGDNRCEGCVKADAVIAEAELALAKGGM